MGKNIDNVMINELIEKAVSSYKGNTYKYLDEVKTLVFTYLLNGSSFEEFENKLNELTLKYNESVEIRTSNDEKKIKRATTRKVMKGGEGKFVISEDELKEMKFKLDRTTQRKARDKYIRVIKRYYRTTNKNLQKTYIDKEPYLTKSVSKFDKIEKVVPYYSKATGTVYSYQDIATYNSMIYNVNLSSTAWNSTFEACKELGEDIVYVEPHPFSCPECMYYQGKFYSVTGKSLKYPPLDEAINGGLKHPNCKHIITTYYGQETTEKYTGEEWEDKYDTKQKINGIKLKISRLRTDLEIYEKIGNGEMVDKTRDKIKLLETNLFELEDLIK